MRKIYLDNNATTALDPDVLSSMLEELKGPPANPSSIHSYGQRAKELLRTARATVAKYLLKKPEEIIFTSGATESLTSAILGILDKKKSGHIISSTIEHPCIYQTLQKLSKNGFDVTFLPSSTVGNIDPDKLQEAITSQTILIVLSGANSETGVKNDIEAFASLAKEKNIPLVIDGVALVGKTPFTIPDGVTAFCFSGHKIHSPKGTGVLYISSTASFSPLFLGGPQEFSKRAGTENLSGIIGIGKAIELLGQKGSFWINQMENLRNYFEKNLSTQVPFIINGTGKRIANTSNLSFIGNDGETLLIQLDLEGVIASHGSACSSGSLEPSRVLLQMGLEKQRARSSIRFSLSRFTTKEEIDQTIAVLTKLINKVK